MSDTAGQHHSGLPASDVEMADKTSKVGGGSCHKGGGSHREVADTGGGDGGGGAGREYGEWRGTQERPTAACDWGERGGRLERRVQWEIPMAQGGNGGGQPPNGALSQPPQAIKPGGARYKRYGKTGMEVVQPRRPRSEAAARPAAGTRRTLPWTGQCGVTSDTCLSRGGGGGTTRGRMTRRRARNPYKRAHGTYQRRQRAWHSAGGLEDPPPPDAPQQGFVCNEGGGQPP